MNIRIPSSLTRVPETSSAPRRRVKLALYSILYILCVHYAYVGYISPTFEYAHYIYLPPRPAALLITYLLAWLPIFAYRPSITPALVAVALIYALSYVPIQLTLLFSIEMDFSRLVSIQIMLATSMVILFASANIGWRPNRRLVSNFARLDQVIGVLTAVAVFLLVASNAQHMRIVSFENVYDLRVESAAVPQSTFSSYLNSWLSYCFISYLYARGLIHKKWTYLVVGLVISILLYAATGAKTAILLLPITFVLHWLCKSGREFLPRLLGTMVITILALVILLPDTGLAMWAKSIILVRVLGTAGWVASKYLEYFGSEMFTYYSHVAPINLVTGAYPYGELSLGQMIGLAYSGSTEANFNGSFWASDGFAAIGPVGVLVITPIVSGVLYLINRSTSRFNPRFAILWMCGFFIALLNVPLSTALLSGGGLLIFLLASVLPSLAQRHRLWLTPIIVIPKTQ